MPVNTAQNEHWGMANAPDLGSKDMFFKQPTSLLQGLARYIATLQYQYVENEECQVRS
jgi:hypothetical protein